MADKTEFSRTCYLLSMSDPVQLAVQFTQRGLDHVRAYDKKGPVLYGPQDIVIALDDDTSAAPLPGATGEGMPRAALSTYFNVIVFGYDQKVADMRVAPVVFDVDSEMRADGGLRLSYTLSERGRESIRQSICFVVERAPPAHVDLPAGHPVLHRDAEGQPAALVPEVLKKLSFLKGHAEMRADVARFHAALPAMALGGWGQG